MESVSQERFLFTCWDVSKKLTLLLRSLVVFFFNALQLVNKIVHAHSP